jgi:hypothetical protein
MIRLLSSCRSRAAPLSESAQAFVSAAVEIEVNAEVEHRVGLNIETLRVWSNGLWAGNLLIMQ